MTHETSSGRPVTDPNVAGPGSEHRVYEERTVVKPARTSAAAAFALVFAVAALVTVLTVVFGPVGMVLGIIGLGLGVVGIATSRKPGITGRGVALGAIVLSVVAILLGGAGMLGIQTILNDEAALDRVEQQIERWRDQISDLDVDVDVDQR